jgi:phospholipid/cholesterol/gamma-HCH transport system substrate-binding protein
MKKKRQFLREIRVGLVIIMALAIVISAVFFIGGQASLFAEKVHYTILFPATAGLYEGDPVLLTGVEVGNVVGIGFPEDIEEVRIRVEIAVSKEAAKRIRENTTAHIASASLVYGKMVQLTMGDPSKPLVPPGGTIKTTETTTYSSIVSSTNSMVEDIRRVLSKIEAGEGMVGTLLNEPMKVRQTLNHLHNASNRLATTLARLDSGAGPLGFMVSNSEASKQSVDDLKTMISDLKAVSENLKGNSSTLGRLINDEAYSKSILEDLRSTLRSLASVAAKIDTGSGALGSLINDPELYQGLSDVVLGIQKSSIAKWTIQNRRKAGEKERNKQEKRK